MTDKTIKTSIIVYGVDPREACPPCKTPRKEMKFRDDLSKKENDISGLCQSCQDDIFGEE